MILGLVSSLNVVTLGGSCLGCWMDSRKASVTQIRQLEYWHCVGSGYEVDRRDHERKVEMSF